MKGTSNTVPNLKGWDMTIYSHVAVNISTIHKNVLTEIVFKILYMLNDFMVDCLSGYPV